MVVNTETRNICSVDRVEKSAKSKSDIIVCLGDKILEKSREIVDDDSESAKELWKKLKRIFTTSSQQEVSNLHNGLMRLTSDENKSWDVHVSTIMSIVDELAAFDQVVTEKTSPSSSAYFRCFSNGWP